MFNGYIIILEEDLKAFMNRNFYYEANTEYGISWDLCLKCYTLDNGCKFSREQMREYFDRGYIKIISQDNV